MESIVSACPSKKALLLAAAVAMAIALFGLGVMPYAGTRQSEYQGFIPLIATVSCVVEALTAYLLLLQFSVFRRPALGLVAAAYAYTAWSGLQMVATVPGVFPADSVLSASPASAAWIEVFWHAGFPVFITAAALVQARFPEATIAKDRIAFAVFASATAPILLALALRWAAISHIDALPAVPQQAGAYGALADSAAGEAVWIANALAVLALLAAARLRSIFFVWLTVAVFAEFVYVALLLSSNAQYTLGWYAALVGRGLSALALLVALLWQAHRLYPLLAKANDELYLASIHDGLTNLFNRRYLANQLDAELARARRLCQPVSLVMIDIDHFKAVNDAYGHPFGDACLCAVAPLLSQHAQRPGDFAARYGGEEFILVLVGTPVNEAADIAERLRREVEALSIVSSSSSRHISIGVTVSIGVATAHLHAMTAERLIAAADRALYAAKENGRNQVCIGELDLPAEAKPNRVGRAPASAGLH